MASVCPWGRPGNCVHQRQSLPLPSNRESATSVENMLLYTHQLGMQVPCAGPSSPVQQTQKQTDFLEQGCLGKRDLGFKPLWTALEFSLTCLRVQNNHLLSGIFSRSGGWLGSWGKARCVYSAARKPCCQGQVTLWEVTGQLRKIK